MKNLRAQALRSVAVIVTAGTLSLLGISGASALSVQQDCRINYLAAGFSSPGECISIVFAGR
jgi:hypothetical protein